MPKICEYGACRNQASYGENYCIPIRCKEHKEDYNLVSKLCHGGDKCKTTPRYNFDGELKGLYCLKHRTEGMINVKDKTCEYPDCKIRATYNNKGCIQATFCNEHKKNGMVDVRHPACKANFCLGTRGNPKYKGNCASCFQHLFPNDPLSFQIRSKTKEIAVRDYINSCFEGFQHDTSLWTGNCDCTHRRRIDHRKLIGNTLLCIETDENQHRGYDENDEEIRYDDLFMLHGGKFVYIRFNPDKFKNKDGNTLNPMISTRLPFLKIEIQKQIKRIEHDENTDLLEVIKLYYDEINN